MTFSRTSLGVSPQFITFYWDLISATLYLVMKLIDGMTCLIALVLILFSKSGPTSSSPWTFFTKTSKFSNEREFANISLAYLTVLLRSLLSSLWNRKKSQQKNEDIQTYILMKMWFEKSRNGENILNAFSFWSSSYIQSSGMLNSRIRVSRSLLLLGTILPMHSTSCLKNLAFKFSSYYCSLDLPFPLAFPFS